MRRLGLPAIEFAPPANAWHWRAGRRRSRAGNRRLKFIVKRNRPDEVRDIIRALGGRRVVERNVQAEFVVRLELVGADFFATLTCGLVDGFRDGHYHIFERFKQFRDRYDSVGNSLS